MRDLTHAEARDAFKTFARSIGPRCDKSIGLETSSWDKLPEALSATFWIDGITGNGQRFVVRAGTYRDLLAAAEAEWADRSDLHAITVTREMALAIIAITADQGECSDAALRATFDAADIKRFGEQACAQATEMASNGPFSIVSLSGANDVGQAA